MSSRPQALGDEKDRPTGLRLSSTFFDPNHLLIFSRYRRLERRELTLWQRHNRGPLAAKLALDMSVAVAGQQTNDSRSER